MAKSATTQSGTITNGQIGQIGQIVRRRTAKSGRTSQEVFAATGRVLYLNDDVVEAMPRSDGREGEAIFFKPDLSKRRGLISNVDLMKEFELRDLDPEFPDNLAAVNEDNPDFADNRPNATIWKDASGKWCYTIFRRWDGERYVNVDCVDRGWGDVFWFAGRPKST